MRIFNKGASLFVLSGAIGGAFWMSTAFAQDKYTMPAPDAAPTIPVERIKLAQPAPIAPIPGRKNLSEALAASQATETPATPSMQLVQNTVPTDGAKALEQVSAEMQRYRALEQEKVKKLQELEAAKKKLEQKLAKPAEETAEAVLETPEIVAIEEEISADSEDYVDGVVGKATVLSSTMLHISSYDISLFGVGASGSEDQRLASKQALSDLIAGKIVTCSFPFPTRADGVIGRCATDQEQDLSWSLLKEGNVSLKGADLEAYPDDLADKALLVTSYQNAFAYAQKEQKGIWQTSQLEAEPVAELEAPSANQTMPEIDPNVELQPVQSGAYEQELPVPEGTDGLSEILPTFDMTQTESSKMSFDLFSSPLFPYFLLTALTALLFIGLAMIASALRQGSRQKHMRINGARRREKMALSAALRGELLAARASVQRHLTLLELYRRHVRGIEMSIRPIVSTRVYDASIDKLWLLGAHDLVEMLAVTYGSFKQGSALMPVAPSSLQRVCEESERLCLLLLDDIDLCINELTRVARLQELPHEGVSEEETVTTEDETVSPMPEEPPKALESGHEEHAEKEDPVQESDESQEKNEKKSEDVPDAVDETADLSSEKKAS